MLPLLTVSQMRAIDHESISGDTSLGYRYMQRAAEGLVYAVKQTLAKGSVAIVCGKGNNGGDGFAAGAMLLDAGYQAMAFKLHERDELAGEALMAFDEYAARKGPFMHVTDPDDLRLLSGYDIVIDAILGSGMRGNPHGMAAQAIEAINRYARLVIAADTPSGLDNDTGACAGPCVRASVTVAMGFAKTGLLFQPGRINAGEILVRDLDYPRDIVARYRGHLSAPSGADLRRLLPPRRPCGSKFDHGQVLTVAGSRGMAGSCSFVCRAALRSGCGMVHAAVPEAIVDLLSILAPETVLHAMAQSEHGVISGEATAPVLEMASRMQCVCIGPGLSHEPEVSAFVRKLVAQIPSPVVLDADGLNAYRGCVEKLETHAGPLIITPHAGEWQRLFGAMPTAPHEIAAELSRHALRLNAVILYKGNPTIVARPDGEVTVISAGTSALATAGSGDILSGMIAGITAQGAELADAAVLASRLHGRAGVLAAATRSDYGVIASDIVDAVALAIRELIATDKADMSQGIFRL